MTLSTGGDIKLKSRPIEGVNVNGTKSGGLLLPVGLGNSD